MKLPKLSGGISRFGVNRAAEESSGILPSKCDWSCRVCRGSGMFKVCWNDPTCEPAKALCRKCMEVCSNLPEGSHARQVCEDKC